jgi:triosephosphate isomerase (TIM)
MPRRIAAGNWKMNGLIADLAEADALAQGVADTRVEVVLCPPVTLVAAMAQRAGAGVAVGAQDCHSAQAGAHTGDISARMLADAGARFVILGHSERRRDHGETSAQVAAKVSAAWEAGLCAIVCLGETEAERDSGQTLAVVAQQLAQSVPAGANARSLVVAYEPVWAIGTGRVAGPDEIAQVHAHLRALLPDPEISLLYGGSVAPTNAETVFAVPDVDGALVGGASLRAKDFLAIVRALAR